MQEAQGGEREARWVDMDSLRLDPENARLHDERNVEVVARSLERFRQCGCIVTHQGVIIAGNATFLAARRLGWKKIKAIAADHLTAEQARLFAIADNRTAELAEWDWRRLAEQVAKLDDDLRLATGFSKSELTPLVGATWEEPGAKRTENLKLKFTTEQAERFRAALKRAKEVWYPRMGNGDCFAAICARFLEERAA